MSYAKPKLYTVAPLTQHTASVIFFHGLGDTGAGWKSLGTSLNRRFPHIKWIFPTAPTQPVTINGGYSMPSWYDIVDLGGNRREGDLEGLEKTRKVIYEHIEEEILNGINPSRIVVGGFSQGAAVSLHSGFTFSKQLAGIIALSGYLPCPTFWEQNLNKENVENVPLLMCHGSSDEVVKLSWGKESFEFIKNKGVNGEFVVIPGMGHSFSDDELTKITQFLSERVA